MSSFSTRRLISFQKDPLPLSFLLFLRKSFFGSNTPPLSEEGIFRQEGGERVTNERGERERFLCPRFNLPDKESPGIYPRLKNPLDMNRATVDVQRDDASFFLDRFLFCHLFPSPPPIHPVPPYSGVSIFHRTHQTFRFHCASIRSIPFVWVDFSRAKQDYDERRARAPLFTRFKSNIRVYSADYTQCQLSPRWIETELYLLKLKILILNRM